MHTWYSANKSQLCTLLGVFFPSFSAGLGVCFCMAFFKTDGELTPTCAVLIAEVLTLCHSGSLAH